MPTEWLKSSIPGIIILGTIGSIIAVYMLALAKWFANRYLWRVAHVYLTQHARPYVRARALTRRLYRHKEVSKLIFFSSLLLLSLALSFLLFSAALLGTIYSFCSTYPATAWWQFILVAVTLVLAHGLLKDISGVAGAWQVLVLEDYNFISKLVGKGQNVWKVMQILDEVEADEAKKREESKRLLQLPTTTLPELPNAVTSESPPQVKSP